MRMCSFSSGVLMLAVLSVGAAQAHNTPQEEANKKVVRDFYIALDDAQAEGTIQQKIAGIIEKYIAVGYIQHQEGGKQGRAGMLETVGTMNARGGAPAAAPAAPPAAGGINMRERAKLVAIMAEGDRVIQVTSRERPDPATGGTKPSYIWNMFRVEKGMLAEHWDSPPANMGQPAGPPPSNK
jgi:predicted SnoaL-like aldol condensation-catalyzing enzyme